jgi:hypothetical protein
MFLLNFSRLAMTKAYGLNESFKLPECSSLRGLPMKKVELECLRPASRSKLKQQPRNDETPEE